MSPNARSDVARQYLFNEVPGLLARFRIGAGGKKIAQFSGARGGGGKLRIRAKRGNQALEFSLSGRFARLLKLTLAARLPAAWA